MTQRPYVSEGVITPLPATLATPAGRRAASGSCWAAVAHVRAFLLAQMLPIGLVVAMIQGIFFPLPGAWLGKNTPLSTICVVGIFLISGLQLRTSEMKKAARAWTALAFSYSSILLFSPWLALWIGGWDLGQREFTAGLALFACMPTTSSSGIVLTAEAGGNRALAVLMTAGTNFIGAATSPLFLAAVLNSGRAGGGSGGGGGVSAVDLLSKLIPAIIVPLAVGLALRTLRRVRLWMAAHLLALRIINNVLLIIIPWIAISSGAALIRATKVESVFILCGLGAGIHAALLLFNGVSCWVMRKAAAALGRPVMPPSEFKAVLIGSSQKSVNMAVTVIAFLPAAVGDKGLLTLPCVLAHLIQITIDAMFVNKLRQYKDDEGLTVRAGASEDAARAAGIPTDEWVISPISFDGDATPGLPSPAAAACPALPAKVDGTAVLSNVSVAGNFTGLDELGKDEEEIGRPTAASASSVSLAQLPFAVSGQETHADDPTEGPHDDWHGAGARGTPIHEVTELAWRTGWPAHGGGGSGGGGGSVRGSPLRDSPSIGLSLTPTLAPVPLPALPAIAGPTGSLSARVPLGRGRARLASGSATVAEAAGSSSRTTAGHANFGC